METQTPFRREAGDVICMKQKAVTEKKKTTEKFSANKMRQRVKKYIACSRQDKEIFEAAGECRDE